MNNLGYGLGKVCNKTLKEIGDAGIPLIEYEKILKFYAGKEFPQGGMEALVHNILKESSIACQDSPAARMNGGGMVYPKDNPDYGGLIERYSKIADSMEFVYREIVDGIRGEINSQKGRIEDRYILGKEYEKILHSCVVREFKGFSNGDAEYVLCMKNVMHWILRDHAIEYDSAKVRLKKEIESPQRGIEKNLQVAESKLTVSCKIRDVCEKVANLIGEGPIFEELYREIIRVATQDEFPSNADLYLPEIKSRLKGKVASFDLELPELPLSI
jgi:hypothetical protein